MLPNAVGVLVYGHVGASYAVPHSCIETDPFETGRGMNYGIKRTAAAALVVGGILVSGAAPADAQAASNAQRITSQDQLFASIQKAVAAEQARGVVTDGPTGGRCTTG